MATRKAASVLPEPVGARRSVLSLREMGGQPSVWAAVGSPNVERNHSATAGWKTSSAGMEIPWVPMVSRAASGRESRLPIGRASRYLLTSQ